MLELYCCAVIRCMASNSVSTGMPDRHVNKRMGIDKSVNAQQFATALVSAIVYDDCMTSARVFRSKCDIRKKTKKGRMQRTNMKAGMKQESHRSRKMRVKTAMM